MKKQYVFIIMIIIIFYISFNIINFTIKEYQINTNIEYIKNLSLEVKNKIASAKNIIEYKTSKAYKNKILKEQQSFKNIWEEVIYFTTEKDFNKYTKIEEIKKEEKIISEDNLEINIKDLSIYERWKYYLFNKK